MKTKEIKSAGFCIVRPDLVKKNLKVPVAEGWYNESRPLPYRWLNDDQDFEVFVNGKWQESESIDFEFLDGEKEIVKAHFKGYRFTNAMDEIKQWSAKDLKEFLRLCGYRTWTKDIMIWMAQDLARIHAFNRKPEQNNPFLVKK